MARLTFVSHTNYDNKGRRVIANDGEAENVYYQSNELDNEKINKLCGLTNSDIMAIRDWLDEAGDRLL